MNSPTDDISTAAILKQLLRDARQSMRQLSAAVGLSPPAVTDRVRRLEDLGFIRGYRPVLDLAKLGWKVSAFVSITAREGRCDDLSAALSALPNVLAAYHVAGHTDYLLRVVTRDLDELKAITDRLAEFGSVSSQIVLGTNFEREVAL